MARCIAPFSVKLNSFRGEQSNACQGCNAWTCRCCDIADDDRVAADETLYTVEPPSMAISSQDTEPREMHSTYGACVLSV